MENTCEQMQERILELITGTLSAEKTAELKKHVTQCPACNEYLQNLQADDKLLGDFAEAMQPSVADVENKVIETLNLETVKEPISPISVWKMIMKSRITKFAAAAVIIIGVFIGVYKYSWTIDGATIAWAEVVEKIKDVNEVSAESWRKFTMVGETDPFWEGKVLKYFSRELGYAEEQYVGEECVLSGCGFFPAKRGVIILHDQKKYFEFDLNDDILFLAEKLNPFDICELMVMFDEIYWKRLGFKKIDGIKTEGFEIKVFELRNSKIAGSFLWKYLLPMENLTFQVWVDTETSLPVELQAEALIGRGFLTCFHRVIASEVIYDIKWSTEVDPNVFKLNIPLDYNMLPNNSLVQ